MKVVCAWCKKVMQDGPAGDVSHSICPKCLKDAKEGDWADEAFDMHAIVRHLVSESTQTALITLDKLAQQSSQSGKTLDLSLLFRVSNHVPVNMYDFEDYVKAKSTRVTDFTITNKLIATQSQCLVDKVRSLIGTPLSRWDTTSLAEPTMIAQEKGQSYIIGGHHRCSAALLMGRPTLKVHLVDVAKMFQEGFARPNSDIKSESGYLYHATNKEHASDIAKGGLKTFTPDHGTDQSCWPDGKCEPRIYFSPNAHTVWQFAPEDGVSVVLRVKRSEGDYRSELGTGDVYSRTPVPATKIEIMKSDGTWAPLKTALTESILTEAKMLPDEARKVLGLKVGFTSDELRTAYRSASKFAHPDAGGSNEAMARVNNAKDALDIVGSSGFASGATQDREAQRNAANVRRATYEQVARDVVNNNLDMHAFTDHFAKAFGEPFRISKSTFSNGGGNGVYFSGEFENHSRTTVLSFTIYVDYTELYSKPAFSASEEGMRMSISSTILHNRKKVKLTQSDYKMDRRYAVLKDPEILFPLKKIAVQTQKAAATTKFGRKDAFLTFEKELSASVDHSTGWVYVPVGEFKIALFRSTMLGQAAWSVNGVYQKYRRVEMPKTFVTFYEKQADMNVLFNCLKDLQKNPPTTSSVIAAEIERISQKYKAERKALNEHIVKLKSGKYRLLSHSGKNLGTFDSHAAAAKHEGEVEYWKHKG